MKFIKPIIELIELNDDIICTSGEIEPVKKEGSSGNMTDHPEEETI